MYDGNRKGRIALVSIIIFGLASGLVNADANLTLAADFLKGRQLADGSFDPFSSPNSAAAAMALFAFEGNSTNVSAALQYLKSDLENPASYSWAEADIPGISLFTYALFGNMSGLNISDVSGRLISMQGIGGGFKGYSQCVENCKDPDWAKQVWAPSEDSISTAMALLGLNAAGALNETIKNESANFLISLKNSDGSFNLTNSVIVGDFWSLGPDIYSQTGFVTLALKEIGYDEADLLGPLAFLRNSTASNFNNNSNATFAPAIVSYVLFLFGDTNNSLIAAQNLRCLQNPDGGYRDTLRFGAGSNALDTAFAIMAMKNHFSGAIICHSEIPQSPSPTPTATSTPATDSSSSSSGPNTNYIPPAATPTRRPSTSPSPTTIASASPPANKKIIPSAISPSPTPKVSLQPATNNKPTAQSTQEASAKAISTNDTTPATGFFSGGVSSIIYGAILFMALGGAYLYISRKK
ncbi:MAG: hypothetical protein AABX01_07890 [Candidatus Micrarchaeota archaeon]